jgi:hypothetical protein
MRYGRFPNLTSKSGAMEDLAEAYFSSHFGAKDLRD